MSWGKIRFIQEGKPKNPLPPRAVIETLVLQDFLQYLETRIKAPNQIGAGTIQALRKEAAAYTAREERTE